METQYISLNMTPTGVNPCFHISQYDVGRMLGFIVHSGGATVDLDTYTCTIEATRSDGTAITSAVATTDNIGTFEVTPTMSNKADKYRCQLVIVDENSKRIASLPFDMEVTKAAMDENSEAIEEDASLYQQYTEAVQGAIAEANADIQAEENARIAAVNAEATARQNADATLQNNIDAEATARANAITAEATARQNADNTLQGNINAEAATRASADSNLQAQINQIISPSGEAPSAVEVQNARIGANGVTYDTLGNAIRGQVSDLKSEISDTRNGYRHILSSEIIQGSYDISGATTTNPARIRVDGFVRVFKGDRLRFVGGSNVAQMLYGTFTTAKVFVRDSAWIDSGRTIEIDSDGYLVLVFRNSSNSTILPSEYDADVNIYTNAVLSEILFNYPFDNRAGLLATSVNPATALRIKNAIKNIHIYNGDPNERYYISYLGRDAENSVASIGISKSDGTKVCSMSEWYHYFPNGVRREVINSVNDSGITAMVDVDWSVWTAGNAISITLADSDQTRISELCCEYEDEQIEILLPSDIYWASGRELSIYFENIILSNNLDNYQIDCVCTQGKHQTERYVWENPTVGTCTLTINVFTRNRTRLLKTATTTIHIVSSAGSGTTKKVLLLGDSWTAQTWYPSYLQSRFAEASDTDVLTLIGTIKPWGDYAGAPIIEGRSGWSSNDYISKSSYLGVTNAFWNPSTSAFDFSYYLSHNNLQAPDIVVLFLGVNDAATMSIGSSLSAFDTIIDSIHSYDSDIKIGLCLVPPPCLSQDGFGKNNACERTFNQQKTNAFNLSVALYEKFNSTSNIYIIPTMSCVDMLHNVSRETVPANAYSDVEIVRLTDNVHCDKAGYQQVADAVYGALKNLY